MKRILITLSLLITMFSINFDSKAAVISAVVSGNWNSVFTWDLGIPACGDTVIIPSGTVVTVTVNVDLNTGDPLCPLFRMTVSGSLRFDNGKKMHLATGACVTVGLGGKVGPSNKGGGASESIYVGPDRVWQASEGVLNGQTSLGCAILLPVTLIDFDVKQLENELFLNWQVESESNVDKYIVEYSMDGKDWDVLVNKEAYHDQTSHLTYEVKTRKIDGQGMVYFKLINQDDNGNKKTLDIVSLELGAILSGNVSLLPNPVEKGSLLTIKYETEADAKTSIHIVDQRGLILFSTSLTESSKNGEFIFDSSILKSGTYFVSLSNKKQALKSKLAVL